MANFHYNCLLWMWVEIILFILLTPCYVIINQSSCCNCLLAAIKRLLHRQQQLLLLYLYYDSDTMTDIWYNQLLWVTEVRPFYFTSFCFDVLNFIFCFGFLLSAVKRFCHKWRQLLPLFSSYVSDNMANIFYNWLLWVV